MEEKILNKVSLSDSDKDTVLELFEDLQKEKDLIFDTMQEITTDNPRANIMITSLMKVFF